MAGGEPPPIVVWAASLKTAVSLKKSSTAACFGPMPGWPRHLVVSAAYTAPHGTILPFQSRVSAAAGGSTIAHGAGSGAGLANFSALKGASSAVCFPSL